MPTKVKKEPVKKTTKEVSAKVATPKSNGLSVPVFSLAGRATGNLTLPKEIFGGKVNEKLLSQAMRVYITNKKILTGSTKGRGEVVGSTAKIYNQKGTGRARHGAITAPIFVGGGIVFGPHPRKVELVLPKKMKKAALLSAFSAKIADKKAFVINGLEKAVGKTAEMAQVLSDISGQKKIPTTLILTLEKMDNVIRAVKNIRGVTALSINFVNAYEVLKHEMLILTKDAVEKLTQVPAKEAK